jgi:site-specific DNA recombinase
MNTCYGYLRVSSDEQVNGFSLDNQERICLEYAKAQGLEVKGIFREEGKSARSTNRPELQRMLKLIEESPVTHVVIMKIDRMCRNVGDFRDLRKYFQKRNITLMSVNEGGNVTNGLIGNIFASVAEWESEVNGNRTRDGMHQKFREGYYPGLSPLGYKNAINKVGKKFIEPDPKTAPLVKEMFRLYATGQYSQLEICEVMYEKGLRGKRRNELLSPQTLTGVFNNTLYYGWMQWGGMEGLGKHTPLIDKDTFDQVQYVLARNNHFLIRKRKNFFVLRGFVYCPIHERRLTTDCSDIKTAKGDKKIGYYRCTHRGGCKSSYCETNSLEKKVAQLFKKYEFSEEFVEMVKTYAKQHLKDSRKHISAKKTALQNQKQGLEQKRNKLEDLLVEGSVDRNVYKRQHDQLEEQLTGVERQLHVLNNKHTIDFSVIDEVLAMTRNLSQSYLEAPDFLKRHYLRLFFERIYIKDKKIVKVVETPIFKVLRQENQLRSRVLLGA